MPRSRWACALLSLAAWGTGAAQEPQESLPNLRITVTLVQVDAVVTDSAGRHITDLQRDDFELLQDGEPQKITYFSYQPAPPPLPPAPDGSSAPLTAGQVRRTVALVVDDLALSYDNIVRVRIALREYVEKQMQPGDLVALIRTGGGVAILEQFTADKRILLEAIDLLKWRFSGRTGMVPIAPTADGTGHRQHSPEMLDYGYTLAALGALNTMEQVIGGMKEFPGRKSVVFFVGRFSYEFDGERRARSTDGHRKPIGGLHLHRRSERSENAVPRHERRYR
jgi:VWFA-related protein